MVVIYNPHTRLWAAYRRGDYGNRITHESRELAVAGWLEQETRRIKEFTKLLEDGPFELLSPQET